MSVFKALIIDNNNKAPKGSLAINLKNLKVQKY